MTAVEVIISAAVNYYRIAAVIISTTTVIIIAMMVTITVISRNYRTGANFFHDDFLPDACSGPAVI